MGKLGGFLSNWDIIHQNLIFSQMYNEIMEMLDFYSSWFQGRKKAVFQSH